MANFMKFIFGHVEAHGRSLDPGMGWTGEENCEMRGAGRDGTGRYCWVSAAEPIKTSTAHYFACFSFDNNAESDPNQPKKKKKKKKYRLQSRS